MTGDLVWPNLNLWWHEPLMPYLPPAPQPFYYSNTSTPLPCNHCWCDEETRGSKEVLHERCCTCQDVRLPAEKEG